jgi:hypothetical protein
MHALQSPAVAKDFGLEGTFVRNLIATDAHTPS